MDPDHSAEVSRDFRRDHDVLHDKPDKYAGSCGLHTMINAKSGNAAEPRGRTPG